MAAERSERAPVRACQIGVALWLSACIAWRVGYVDLLGMPTPVPAVLGAIAGSLWIDALIGVVLLWWALATVRLRGWRRALSAVGMTLAFAYVCAARLGDHAYFHYAGDHVDVIAIQHLQGDAFGMKLDDRMAGYLAIAVPVAGLCLAAVAIAAWLARSAPRRRIGSGVLAPAGLLAITGLLASWLLPNSGRAQELRGAPEVDIPRVWLSSSSGPIRPEGLFLLDPVVKNKLRRFGIRIDEKRDYPLVEPRVFDAPIDVPRSKLWVEKPNVIVLFFESFSTELTSLYSDRFPGLTPNLEAFAERAFVVEDFFNASTPTVASLTCCFGSYLPVTNTMTWYLEENNSGKTRLRCLPHILDERGWQTVHVHSLTNDFVRTGEAVSRLGFGEVVDGTAIGRELGERRAHWGFSDHQIFRYLTERLAAGGLRRPFLLSAATVDSHAPFLPSVEAPPYGDASKPILSAIHSADHAFGAFWRWFEKSSYADDTIVVVLADHAMFPGKELAEVRPDTEVAGRYYDRILCAIYDPTHDLVGRERIVSSQIDLTPTLLHLLGIDVPNHFDGHSIFGGRARYPRLIGMHEYLFGVCEGGPDGLVVRNFKLEDVEAACRDWTSDPTSISLTRCEYLHFYKWRRAIHTNNRVWPPD